MMCFMSKREYLIELKKKYWKARKRRKTQLLSDFCAFTRYHRKSALRLLNNSLPCKWKHYKQRKKYYGQPVIDVLLVLWRACDEICAERFHPFIPGILNKLLECGELSIATVTPEIKKKLLEISLGTVKKIIRRTKRRSLIRIRGTTRPGSLLKSQIAIRYGDWKDKDPGYTETDTVAHCGDNLKGEFIYSLNVIDLYSGWSEQAAVWGKGELATCREMDKIRCRLPFALKGLNPDNGSEFINYHLQKYCKLNKITLTRTRPYHKNDNPHIEQKNWTAIRQLIGYKRLNKKKQQYLLNDLYQNEWRFYLNFFQPMMKLKKRIKNVQTGKLKKKYYKAKTPYQRLLEHKKTTKEQCLMLTSIYKQLNPIKLQQEIKRKLELIQNIVK